MRITKTGEYAVMSIMMLIVQMAHFYFLSGSLFCGMYEHIRYDRQAMIGSEKLTRRF